jgi:phage I-like protein
VAKSASAVEFEKIVAFKAIKNSALDSKTLPTRLKILNWGVNQTVIGPVTVDATSASMIPLSQDSKGFKEIAIDFEHNTVPGSLEYNRTNEPRPVAGYGTPEIVTDDGIYLENIRWTPEGERMALNFSDLSPALITEPNTGAVTFIHSVALCRNGAVDGLTFHSATLKDAELIALAAKKVVMTKGSGQRVEKGDEVVPLEKSEQAKEDGMANYKAFPAWELVRVEPSEVPRGSSGKPNDLSWPDRWRMAGGRLFSGRMIANKLDEIWSKLGDSDEFDDAVDSDVPPFAYNSGYGWMEVDAETCKELGVRRTIRGKQSDKKMPPVSLRNFSAEETNNTGEQNMAENNTQAIPDVKAEIANAVAPLVEQLKTFSAEIASLKSAQAASVAAGEKIERENIIAQATKDGKIIPLSAESLNALSVPALKEMVGNLKAGAVTLTASSGATAGNANMSAIDRVKAANAQAYAQIRK